MGECAGVGSMSATCLGCGKAFTPNPDPACFDHYRCDDCWPAFAKEWDARITAMAERPAVDRTAKDTE